MNSKLITHHSLLITHYSMRPELIPGLPEGIATGDDQAWVDDLNPRFASKLIGAVRRRQFYGKRDRGRKLQRRGPVPACQRAIDTPFDQRTGIYRGGVTSAVAPPPLFDRRP